MSTPILRWAGSKKKLLPILEAATPKRFNRYIEPFVGSAVLFLKLNAQEALLGDLNSDLIGAYETIRDKPKALWTRISAMSQQEDFYYELRATNPKSLSKIGRAARFIYLNRFCFNGVYRTNKSGEFNVARGKGNLYIPSLDVFLDFSQNLKRTQLSCIDFEAQVNKAKKNDFLYLDPPYALGEKRDRGEYGPNTFRETDEDRLIKSILRASDRGANVLLSYSPSKNIIKNLKGWNIHNLSVMRNVAGFADSRKKANEILVSNYDWK